MKRLKMITTLVASVVAFAAMPVIPALASANATARLTNNAAVYPGNYTYTLNLTNNEPAGNLINPGKAINFFIVELPQGAGITIGDGVPTAAGWTATKDRVNGTDWVIFEGGSLAAGRALSVNIPAVANAPKSCDRSGTWRLRVSSDNGETLKTAAASSPGALDARVLTLEVLQGSFKPTHPTNADNSRGVTDRSGTAGQLITYEYQVKNHALNDQSVTGVVESSATEDSPGPGTAQPIAGNGGVATYTIPIQLGSASTQRTTTFTATATATCSAAPALPDNFIVQVPVNLSFTGLNPVRVRSGENSARTFAVTAVKTGGARFELREGTLTFGTNAANLQDPPRTFNAGNQNMTLNYAIAEITGPEGTLKASITSKGEDYNLAPVDLVRDAGEITLDITAPIVKILEVVLPKDVDGDQQVAVKHNDTITASGEVLGTDLASGCPTVQIVPNAGASRNMSVTCSANSDGSGKTWKATASGAHVWDAQATAFSLTAAMRDQAENEGTAVAPGPYLIDLREPALGGYASQLKGVVVAPRRITVTFEDNLNLVRGGCDPESWLVDGQLQVENVYLGDGTKCNGPNGDPDANPPVPKRRLTDGVRILELYQQFEKKPHEEPPVTYVPRQRALGFYPTKDGAQNDSLQKTIETITAVKPPTPQITAVQRRDGGAYEAAYLDGQENAYYTNVGGTDGVRLSWTFMTAVTPTEVTGYKVIVTDAAGNTLSEVPATGQNPISGAWSGQINVPLPEGQADNTTDGAYLRKVFVVSPRGVLSEKPTEVTLVLDTILPTLSTDTYDGTSTVDVSFTEKIVAGSNFASDWVISYEIQGEDGTELASTQADAVSAVDQLTRRLTISLPDPTSYRATDYRVRSATRQRYEDRAGNLMLNTL